MTPSKPPEVPSPSRSSAWAPLRNRAFAFLWLAQLFSNIGTWMQVVGATWLMGNLGGTSTEVALIQTATNLPVFLIGAVSGALADVVDRRRLLLAAQAGMLAVAGGLTVSSASNNVSPWLLLAFTFAIGLGTGLTTPAWQATTPELVAHDQLRSAISLGSVSMNVGRAIGPAAGGLLVAASGPTAVFAFNTVSFVGVVAVLLAWKRHPPEQHHTPERLGSALRTGIRYAKNSPALRGVLFRVAALVIPSSALLALLPVVARNELHLGSGGFGALFACFGVGAIASALLLLPRLHHLTLDHLVILCSVGLAFVLIILALSPAATLTGVALFLGGACWTMGVSSCNVAAQSVLPAWVRARGMSLYVLTLQGSQAVGSALFGLIAGAHLAISLILAAALLLAGLLGSSRWRLDRSRPINVELTEYWPEPNVIDEPDPEHGPVLVITEYQVAPGREEEFETQMRRVRRVRLRTGARVWGLYRDAAHPSLFVETFLVPSWEEHLRQHGRTTASDQQTEGFARSFLIEGTVAQTRHLLWAYE